MTFPIWMHSVNVPGEEPHQSHAPDAITCRIVYMIRDQPRNQSFLKWSHLSFVYVQMRTKKDYS